MVPIMANWLERFIQMLGQDDCYQNPGVKHGLVDEKSLIEWSPKGVPKECRRISYGTEEPPKEYTVGGFHPVYLNDIIQGDGRTEKYQIKAKLGYGGYSTVWLALDIR